MLRVLRIVVLSTVVTMVFPFLSGPATASQDVTVNPQISTNRGCLENGRNAVFQVGEGLQITIRIDSSVARQAQATIEQISPSGQAQVIFQANVPTNQQINFNPATIRGPQGMWHLRLTACVAASSQPGVAQAQRCSTAVCGFVVQAAQVRLSAQVATDRGCLGQGQNPVYQIGEQIQFLFTINGATQAEATLVVVFPSGRSQVALQSTPVNGGTTYRYTAILGQPPGTWKIQLTARLPGGQGEPAQAECSFTVQAAAARVQQLLGVGDTLAVTAGLGIFGPDPLEVDRSVSAIRRIADDGSVFVADYAGGSLLRFGAGARIGSATRGSSSDQARVLQAGGSPVLLDTSAQDPVDRFGLARILRVETGRDGMSAVLALRADNTRGIYRLDRGTLTRLSLLPGATGAGELAIGDAGQIAFVAPIDRSANPSSPLALFQTVGGQPAPQVSQGQVLGDLTVTGFRGLQSNGSGVLTYLLDLRRTDGTAVHAVMRGTTAGHAAAAVTGRVVPGFSGPLTEVRQPRIGPDGTVVFLGIGNGFVNFFADGPGRTLAPLLPGTNWNPADGTFDYDIGDNGSIAVRAAPGQATDSGLYLVPRTGGAVPINGGPGVFPVGQPLMVPQRSDNLLFFLAKNVNAPQLNDRNGRPPLIFCRSRLVGGQPNVDAAAAPGQPVPGKPGAQLLTMAQRPVVAGNTVVFEALYSPDMNAPDHTSAPVPAAGLFRTTLDGKPEDIRLVAEEGADLPGGERLALMRELSYTPDGVLTVRGLLPGAGPLVAALQAPRPASTQAVRPSGAPLLEDPLLSAPVSEHRTPTARIQAAPAATVTPLVAIGQPLDRPERRLLAVLGGLVTLGSNRQLLAARFSQAGGTNGEGLFSIGRDGVIQKIAATGETVLPGVRFAGFADTVNDLVNPPTASADGNVVFKALLDRSGKPAFGIFQWTGTAPALIAIGDDPDRLRVTSDDLPPYNLRRWSAGRSGQVFLLEQHQTRSAAPIARLFQFSAAGPSALASGGVSDFVLASDGSVFLTGAAPGGLGLFRTTSGALTQVVMPGFPIPRFADGTAAPGGSFDGSLQLLPDSARGDLLFTAGVAGLGGASRKGLFRMNQAGAVETVLVEGIGVAGARNLTVETLATSATRQTANRTTASAIFSNGHWQILRSRAGVDSRGQTTFTTVSVVEEGKALPNGTRVVSLDPSPVLDLPPTSGPVFTLNDTGDVAFMASDGQRWGVFVFSDAGQ